jgi:hypothetical protein
MNPSFEPKPKVETDVLSAESILAKKARKVPLTALEKKILRQQKAQDKLADTASAEIISKRVRKQKDPGEEVFEKEKKPKARTKKGFGVTTDERKILDEAFGEINRPTLSTVEMTPVDVLEDYLHTEEPSTYIPVEEIPSTEKITNKKLLQKEDRGTFHKVAMAPKTDIKKFEEELVTGLDKEEAKLADKEFYAYKDQEVQDKESFIEDKTYELLREEDMTLKEAEKGAEKLYKKQEEEKLIAKAQKDANPYDDEQVSRNDQARIDKLYLFINHGKKRHRDEKPLSLWKKFKRFLSGKNPDLLERLEVEDTATRDMISGGRDGKKEQWFDSFLKEKKQEIHPRGIKEFLENQTSEELAPSDQTETEKFYEDSEAELLKEQSRESMPSKTELRKLSKAAHQRDKIQRYGSLSSNQKVVPNPHEGSRDEGGHRPA